MCSFLSKTLENWVSTHTNCYYMINKKDKCVKTSLPFTNPMVINMVFESRKNLKNIIFTFNHNLIAIIRVMILILLTMQARKRYN